MSRARAGQGEAKLDKQRSGRKIFCGIALLPYQKTKQQ